MVCQCIFFSRRVAIPITLNLTDEKAVEADLVTKGTTTLAMSTAAYKVFTKEDRDACRAVSKDRLYCPSFEARLRRLPPQAAGRNSPEACEYLLMKKRYVEKMCDLLSFEAVLAPCLLFFQTLLIPRRTDASEI